MQAVASPPRNARQIRLLYAIFFISGFCGLIYESIWSHYLKLLLGHAAYAQDVVLVEFAAEWVKVRVAKPSAIPGVKELGVAIERRRG